MCCRKSVSCCPVPVARCCSPAMFTQIPAFNPFAFKPTLILPPRVDFQSRLASRMGGCCTPRVWF
ncbi:hypothetical protein [Escherichia phage SUT_E520]|nr:hypothetical protein [Escherichia phage SUT_E520]